MGDSRTITINLKAVSNFSDVLTNVKQVQTSLNQLKLPESLKTNFAKSFIDLEKHITKAAEARERINSGKGTKSDVSTLEHSVDQINKIILQMDGNLGKIDSHSLAKVLAPEAAKETEASVKRLTAELEKAKPPGALKELQNIVSNLKSNVKGKTHGLFDEILGSAEAGDFDKAKKQLVDLKKYVEDLSDAGTKKGLYRGALREIENILNTIDTSKIKQITSEIEKTKQGTEQLTFKKVTDKLLKIDGFREIFKQLGIDVANFGKEQDKAAASSQQLSSQLDMFKSRVAYFFGLNNAVNLFQRSIRSTIETVKDLDAVMTETAVVTKFDVSDMWKQLPEYTQRANELGATIHDVYEASTLYYQQGLSTNEVMAASNETLKMARIAGLEAAEATDRMTNALRGFNMEINDANTQKINDVYSNLAAKSASNVDEISTAMTKVASLANNANMSFENTAAFLSQIIETTRESAETAGTALKTVIARFSEVKKLYSEGELMGTDEEGQEIDVNKVSQALRTAGINLNEYLTGMKGLDDIFMELSQKWDDLDQVQQRYIATMAAGSRQQSRFIALMQDNARMTELVGYANNAAGASEEQFGKTLESLEAKINKLKNAWNTFLMGIANNEAIKFVVDALTELLTIINKIMDAMPEFLKPFASLGAVFGGLKLGGAVFDKMFSSVAALFFEEGKKAGISFGKGVEAGAATTQIKKTSFLKNFFNIGDLKNQTREIEKVATVTNIHPYTRQVGTSTYKKIIEEQLSQAEAAEAQAKAYKESDEALKGGLVTKAKSILLDTRATIAKKIEATATKMLTATEKADKLATEQGTIATIKNAIAKKMLANNAILATIATLGLIAAIAALVAGIVLLIKYLNSLTPEAKFKKAQEAAEKAAEAAEKVKGKYDDLKSSLDEISDKKAALDEMTRGTKEWKDAVFDLNEKVLELARNYDGLIVKNENGVLTLTQDSMDAVLEQQEKAARESSQHATYSRRRELEAQKEVALAKQPYYTSGMSGYSATDEKLTLSLIDKIQSGEITTDTQLGEYLDSIGVVMLGGVEGAVEALDTLGKTIYDLDSQIDALDLSQAASILSEAGISTEDKNYDMVNNFVENVTDDVRAKVEAAFDESKLTTEQKKTAQEKYAKAEGFSTWEEFSKERKVDQETLKNYYIDEQVNDTLVKAADAFYNELLSKGADDSILRYLAGDQLGNEQLKEAGAKRKYVDDTFRDYFSTDTVFSNFAEDFKNAIEAEIKLTDFGLEGLAGKKISASSLNGIMNTFTDINNATSGGGNIDRSNALWVKNFLNDSLEKIVGEENLDEALGAIGDTSISSAEEIKLLQERLFELNEAGLLGANALNQFCEKLSYIGRATNSINIDSFEKNIGTISSLYDRLTTGSEEERANKKVSKEEYEALIELNPEMASKFSGSEDQGYYYIGGAMESLVAALDANTAAQLDTATSQLEAQVQAGEVLSNIDQDRSLAYKIGSLKGEGIDLESLGIAGLTNDMKPWEIEDPNGEIEAALNNLANSLAENKGKLEGFQSEAEVQAKTMNPATVNAQDFINTGDEQSKTALLQQGAESAYNIEAVDQYMTALQDATTANDAFAASQLASLTNTAQLAKEYEVESDDLNELAKSIKKSNKGMQDSNAYATALKQIRLEKSIKNLRQNYDAWTKSLKKVTAAKGDLSQIEAEDRDNYEAYRKEVRGLIGANHDLTDSFFENEENLKNIDEVINGGEGAAEALRELQQQSAKDYVVDLQAKADTAEAQTALEELANYIGSYDLPEVEAGAQLEDQDFINELNNLIAATGMTSNQVQSMLGNMGFDAEIEEVEDTTSSTHVVHGERIVPNEVSVGKNGKDKMIGYTVEPVEATYTDTVTTKIPVIKTMTANGSGFGGNVSTGGGGGGGGGGGCFVAGTLVTTNYSFKNIEDIKIGDIVLSYNEKTKENEYSEVVETMIHYVYENIYTLFIEDEELVVTGIHRFLITRNGIQEWIPASDLRVNDLVLFADGTLHRIFKIGVELKAETVYNFEVSGNHNYYVGKKQILAHNKGGGGGGSGKSEKPTYFENPYDPLTNTLEHINSLIKQREKLEKKYGNIIKSTVKSSDRIRNNVEKQLDVLREQRKLQKEVTKGRKKEIADALKEEYTDENGKKKTFKSLGVEKYGGLVYDKKSGQYELHIKWDKIQALEKSSSKKEEGEQVQAYIDYLKDLQQKYNESKDAEGDIEDQIKELKKGSYWENSFEKIHNELQQLEYLERRRNELAKQENLFLSKNVVNAKKMQEYSTKEFALIQKQIKGQRELVKYYTKSNRNIMKRTYTDSEGNRLSFARIFTGKTTGKLTKQDYKDAQKEAAKYVKYDENTGKVTINWDKINKVSKDKYGEGFGEAIEAYAEILQENAEGVAEANETLLDLKQELQDRRKEALESNIDFEQRVYDALVSQREAQIEKTEELINAVNENATKVLDNMQEQIQEQRQARENEKQKQELQDKQSRLAYLRRDTSGANALQIKQLEKDLQQSKESFSDSLVDQALDNMRKDAEKAAQQRERQVQLMRDQLKIEQKTGVLWNEVYHLINDAIGAGKGAMKSDLGKLLREAEDYSEKSLNGQAQWKNEFKEILNTFAGNEKTLGQKKEGEAPTENGWVGKQYFKNGVAVTGKQPIKNSKGKKEEFLFNDSGNMLTGKQGDSFYYTKETNGHSKGAKAKNAWIKDGSGRNSMYADKSGKLVSGYQKLKSPSGKDVEAYFDPKTHKRVYASKGQTVTRTANGKGYEIDDQGKVIRTFKVGNQKDSKGNNYWFNNKGEKEGGLHNGKLYKHEGAVGKEAKDEWVYDKATKAWYYAGSDGKPVKSQWKKRGGVDYYLGSNGKVATNKLIGKKYYVGKDGKKVISNWAVYKDKRYYLDANGEVVKGWKKISGKWYYFEKSGAMFAKKEGILPETNGEKFFFKFAGVGSTKPNPLVEKLTKDKKTSIKKYARGGLVDFTGPAWLDGTSSRPEVVLNPKQTEIFMKFTDMMLASTQGKSTPAIGGNNYYTIQIDAEIASDYDVDRLAARIEKKIKDDSMYRNVNAISFIR